MSSSQKTFFIIPGFKQKASDSQFLWLHRFLKSKGFNVMGAPVDWNYRTNSQIADDFIAFYDKHKTGHNRVLGFSYGAVVALMSAKKISPDRLYLCSLSPDFSEDLLAMRPIEKRFIGKKRLADVATRSALQLAKGLTIPTVVFCGEKEAKKYPQLELRCRQTADRIKGAKLVMVDGAPHQIDFLTYVDAIKVQI